MKDKAWWTAQLQRLTGLAIQYKYVLLVILAGVVLLLLPSGGDQKELAAQVQSEPSVEQEFDLAQTEQRLAQALSKIDGAGEVTVVLTLAGSSRQVLAQDSNSSWQEGGQEESRTTVVISQGSGVQQTVALQQLSPEFQGALVVCSGGDDPAVRLTLTQAVSALTGLGADKISVCAGG